MFRSAPSHAQTEVVITPSHAQAHPGAQEEPSSAASSSKHALASTSQPRPGTDSDLSSARTGDEPALASASGWAICRRTLAQAPHRGLALALAYHAARGRRAALEMPLRLAVIGARLSQCAWKLKERMSTWGDVG